MYKAYPKNNKNQHSNRQKSKWVEHPWFINRQIKRSKIFRDFMKIGSQDPQGFALWLAAKERHGGKQGEPGLIWQFMNYLLYMAHQGRYLCASTRYLSEKFDCHEKSIPRITSLLADMGVIKKCYRGMKKSVFILLNPVFEQQHLLQFLSPLFPWLRKVAFSSVFATYTFALSPFKIMDRLGDQQHVTYRYIGTLFLSSCSKKDSLERESLTSKSKTFSLIQDLLLQKSGSLSNGRARAREELVERRTKRGGGFKSIASVLSSAYGPQLPAPASPIKKVSEELVNDTSTELLAPKPRHSLFESAKIPKRGKFMSDSSGTKFSYYQRLDGFIKLRATPFGKMKLSVIPEGVLFSCYNHWEKEHPDKAQFDYHKFFDFCVEKAGIVPIDLKPRWKRFFAACRDRGIDAKKERCVYQDKPKPYVAPERAEEDPEDGFWTCEKHTLSEQYAKAISLMGYLVNPYQKRLSEIGVTKHPELFKMYQAAHTDGIPQPGEAFEAYKEALKKLKEDETVPFP